MDDIQLNGEFDIVIIEMNLIEMKSKTFRSRSLQYYSKGKSYNSAILLSNTLNWTRNKKQN